MVQRRQRAGGAALRALFIGLLGIWLAALAGCGEEEHPSVTTTSAEVCDDGADNDEDGDADCGDPDCQNTPRCRRLAAGEICDDGADNDEDGAIDCDDPDCDEAQSCQVDAEVCGDGADNDGDGDADCDDPDCSAAPGCAGPGVEVCGDGADNDGDGDTDCDDPDCSDNPICAAPDVELCDDGADNDGDGDTDCDDADCEGALPCAAPDVEVCDDGTDNDGDGDADCDDADCGDDPACAAPDVEVCDDGADNDGDGDADCEDADCEGALPCVAPDAELCDDGADNDGDGDADCDDADCGDDPACPVLDAEVCVDGLDNDLDGDTDCDDPDCEGALPCAAPDVELCDDDADNDGDGDTDCDDADCEGVAACAPPDAEVCDDGADNDGDGDADCDDADCARVASCLPTGPGTCEAPLVIKSVGFFPGSAEGTRSHYRGSCGGAGFDQVWVVSSPEAATLCIDALDAAPDAILYARAARCDDPAAEVACSVGLDAGLGQPRLQLEVTPGVPYYVFADSAAGGSAYTLAVNAGPCDQAEFCSDNLDNDENGRTDCADPSCREDEACERSLEICSDDYDNDADGFADCADLKCSADRGCQQVIRGSCSAPLLLDRLGGQSNLLEQLELEEGAIREFRMHQGTCGGEGTEDVWRFDPEFTTRVCISASHVTGSTLDHIYMYARRGGCEGLSQEVACLADASGAVVDLEFVATAGTPYFIFVDSSTISHPNPYTLRARYGPCGVAPAAEVCGDGLDNDQDGRADCLDGECSAAPACRPGSGTCAVPWSLGAPGVYAGSLGAGASSTVGSCGGSGAEVVWTFTPEEEGVVCLDATETTYDAALYVRRAACAGGAELACDATQGARRVEIEVEAGETYYAFIDATSASTQSGQHSLDLYPGPCAERVEVCDDGIDNDHDGAADCLDQECRVSVACTRREQGTCRRPLEITEADTFEGTTASAPNERSGSCGLSGDAEEIWHLQRPEDTTVCLSAKNAYGGTTLYVQEEMCETGASSLCHSVSVSNASAQLELTARAGRSYFIAVEPRGASFPVPYTLDVRFGPCATPPPSEVCTDGIDNDRDDRLDCADRACRRDPACNTSRGTCESPAGLVPGLQGADSQNNTLSVEQGSCGGAGFEVAWSFAREADGPVCLSTVGSAYDTVLYVREGDCDGAEIACNDDIGFLNNRSRVEVQARAGTRYVVLVDSWGARRGLFFIDMQVGPCVIEPTAEVCDDGDDNDLDELTDCLDDDCLADPACRVPDAEVCDDSVDNDEDGDTDCDDADCDSVAVCAPPGAEICNDGMDNDRDGDTDAADEDCVSYVDGDGDGYCPAGRDDNRDGDCDEPGEALGPRDCNDANVAIHPGADEVCDGVDNDCAQGTLDGVDEPDYGDACDSDDADRCARGTTRCLGGVLTCQGDTPVVEVCDDGADNDCDDQLDCDDDDCAAAVSCVPLGAEVCGDGVDNNANGLTDCADPACIGAAPCFTRDGTCARPLVIDAAGTFSGDTRMSPSIHQGACRPVASREHVWLLVTEETTPVCLTTTGTSYSTVLYARSASCTGAELVCNEGFNGDARIEFTATAGEPYFVFMDGLNGGTSFEGPYQLNVRFGPCGVTPSSEVCNDGVDNNQDGHTDCADPDCAVSGACLQGSGSCADPFVLPPSGRVSGLTSGATGVMQGSCGGAGAEAVWTFSVEESMRVCLDTRGSTYDTVLHVRAGTCGAGEAEVACDDNGAGLRSEVEIDATAGEPYFVFVDGRGALSGRYGLNLTPGPCASRVEVCDDGRDNDEDGALDCADPDCASDAACPTRDGSCELPFVLEQAGVVHGDTTGSFDQRESTCRPVDGPEDIWVFQTDIDTPVCIDLDGASEVLYVRTGGCAGGGYAEAACIYGPSQPRAELMARAGVPYFVFVDGFNGANYGPYQLTVRYGPCATQPAAEACGDGLDNDHDAQVDCYDATCRSDPGCVPGSGTCADPFEVLQSGSYTGQLAGAANMQQGSCGGAGFEEVWSFTREADGPVCLSTVGSTYDTVLYVREGDCDQGDELACNDDAVGAASQVEIATQAGMPYFIVVDARSSATQSGAYSLDLFEGACSARQERCGDGLDNDLNGLIDCLDGACAALPECPAGAVLIAQPGQTISLNGSLSATDPVWARPYESCQSGSGSFFYDTHLIINTSSSPRTLTLTATWSSGRDGYLHLFLPPFAPPDLSRCVIGDDDFNGTAMSQIAGRVLMPGQVWVLVASTYSPGEAIGPYTIEVRTQ